MLPRNAFIGKIDEPTDGDLASELGAAKTVWDGLLSELRAEYDLKVREWNSYSRKAGWALRLKREKRNIVYLSPCRGFFVAAFALGEKAMAAARQSGLPKHVMKILEEARKYAEGTAVRLEVHGGEDITAVKKLVGIKLAN